MRIELEGSDSAVEAAIRKLADLPRSEFETAMRRRMDEEARAAREQVQAPQGMYEAGLEAPTSVQTPNSTHTLIVSRVKIAMVEKLNQHCRGREISLGDAIESAINILLNTDYDIMMDVWVPKGRAPKGIVHGKDVVQVRSQRLAKAARDAGLEVLDAGRITIPPRASLPFVNVGVDPVVLVQVE